MSLRAAVEDVVQQIEECLTDHQREPDSAILIFTLKSFARQLRTALKASEGEAEPVRSPLLYGGSMDLQREVMVNQAREELRKSRQAGRVQETLDPRMVEALGGDSDGTMVPISPEMPVGANCMLGQETYRLLADGRLHFQGQPTPSPILLPE